MAQNTPKRLKTAIPSACVNYLSTPPPSVRITGSPPHPGVIGTPTSDAQTPGGQQHPSQAWSNSWLSDATTPTSSCSSPDGHHNRSFGGHNSSGTPHNWSSTSGGGGSAEKAENKRGRPRSEALTTLMVEGSISPSSIKCHYCNRVFPREKSLQAHLRTHTGERPYHCDYPGCTRAFTQSGQLKTHQRLHTGERPFICSATNCQMRFTHANRHCPDHPNDTLKRCDDFVIQTVPEQNSEVLKWLEKYRAEREDRTPTRKTPKRIGSSSGGSNGTRGIDDDGVDNAQNEVENQRSSSLPKANIENHLPVGINGSNGAVGGAAYGGVNNEQLQSLPLTPYKSSRKGLMDMNAGSGSPVLMAKAKNSRPKLIQWQEPTNQDESGDECCAPSTLSTYNPKKKWLQDACQDELAKPLEPNLISQKVFSSTTSTMALKQQLHQEGGYIRSPVKRQLLSAMGHTKPLPRIEGFGGASLPVPVLSPIVTAPPIDPNQTRPTVLMVASKDCARPLFEQHAPALVANGGGPPSTITSNSSPKPEENNRMLQGALALMQLATKNALLGGSFANQGDLGENEPSPYLEGLTVPPASLVPSDLLNTAIDTNGHASHQESYAESC
ncbi:uncharacterized protein LOC128728504 [Anopheles nili]|uniref:uncharacterized protein LOC128728504 n=1 Tax=Anopheles nili TaxID=185578 RepID=UPI00237B7FF5|nr:uncharacterized protein LOC128728504 [Anopheles nili]